MLDTSKIRTASDRARNLVVRVFLKTVGALALVFVIAAIAAPRLFDVRNDFAVVLAFALWISCPLILFLCGWNIRADLRNLNDNNLS